MPVHHVHLYAVGPGRLRLAHLLSEPREIGGEYRRRDLDFSIHTCLYFICNCAAAALSTNQITSPWASRRSWAGYSSGLYSPSSTSRRAGALLSPVTRKTTSLAAVSSGTVRVILCVESFST